MPLTREDWLFEFENWDHDLDVTRGGETVVVKDGSCVWVAWLDDFERAKHTVLAYMIDQLAEGAFDSASDCDKTRLLNHIYREIYKRTPAFVLAGDGDSSMSKREDIFKLVSSSLLDCTCEDKELLEGVWRAGYESGCHAKRGF